MAFFFRCLAIVLVFAFYTYVQPCNLLTMAFFFSHQGAAKHVFQMRKVCISWHCNLLHLDIAVHRLFKFLLVPFIKISCLSFHFHSFQPGLTTMVQKDQAARLKEEGNTLFAQKDYVMASVKYTEAIAADGTNAVLYANRAACRLAMRQWGSQ